MHWGLGVRLWCAVLLCRSNLRIWSKSAGCDFAKCGPLGAVLKQHRAFGFSRSSPAPSPPSSSKCEKVGWFCKHSKIKNIRLLWTKREQFIFNYFKLYLFEEDDKMKCQKVQSAVGFTGWTDTARAIVCTCICFFSFSMYFLKKMTSWIWLLIRMLCWANNCFVLL